MKLIDKALVVAALACCASAVMATENPVSTPNGADGFLAGALPPPGTYNLLFGNYYTADRANDGNGNSAVPGFHVRARVIADKVLHMTTSQLFGGSLGYYAAAPLIDLRVEVPGLVDTRTGLGDVEGGMILGWHAPDLHWYALATLVVPTGAWDRTRVANLGSNYVTFRPQFGISYLPKSGLDLSARVSYSFNARNRATDYQSGQYFHADFNAGWALNDAWKLGLQGYYLKQTTDDTVGGAAVGPDGNRAQVFALGPGVVYQHAGVSYEFKYLRESMVRNRAQGNSAWAKVVWRF